MNPDHLQKLFADREKQILEEVSQLAQAVAKKELALLEFELFSEVMIPLESKEKAETSLQTLRKERWKEALHKAHGNEEEAIFFYAP